MIPQALWGVITVAVTVAGSYMVARLGARAEQRKAELAAKMEERKFDREGDVSAGKLALEIATEARDEATAANNRLRDLDRWRRLVERWWGQHNVYDQAVLDELEALDPTAASRLPDLPPMPVYEEKGGK